MYPCCWSEFETALRIVSALRWRNVRKSQSFERVSWAPFNAALDFSFWYRDFLASQFCTTYGEICSIEKRVCLFKCNVENVQTIDTERTWLTSQIFVVVDFAKHRLGMRRLHLRHWGNIRQYSHGSTFTPSTPQLEQLIVTCWRLAAISETIEQKWWERVKLTSGIVLSQQHYFRAQNYERYGTQIRYIRENFTSIQTKKTSLTNAVRCSWKRWWWRLFGFMLRWKCGWGVVFWNTQTNKRTILIVYKVHSRCVVNRNK